LTLVTPLANFINGRLFVLNNLEEACLREERNEEVSNSDPAAGAGDIVGTGRPN
jgi:hypothetical protein